MLFASLPGQLPMHAVPFQEAGMLQRYDSPYGDATPFRLKLSCFGSTSITGRSLNASSFARHVADGSGSTCLILFGGAGGFGGTATFGRIPGRTLLNPH
ncbi:hypothetical protein ACVWZM_001872 [Bradyrhizobium sp. USDA 4501]